MAGGVLAVVALGCGSDGDGQPTGIIPGTALGKFCHELNRGGLPVTLTLHLGEPTIASITARTGVCAPMAGMPCATIPIGRVPLRLMEADRVLTTRSVILSAPDAGMLHEYVFQPVITNDGTQVVITGGRLAEGTCMHLDFPPPDGGVRGDGGEGGNGGDGGAVTEAGADAAAPPVDAAPDVAAPDAGVDAPSPADAAATVDAPDHDAAPAADLAAAD